MPNSLACSVGIELELSNQAGVSADIREIEARLVDFPGWKVKPDGSCGVNGAGPEVISPILRTEDDLATVDQICRELSRLGYEATPKCGFHVHLGVSHLTAVQRDRWIKFMHRFENVFFKLAPGRREARWCRPLTAEQIAAVRRGEGWNAWHDRYFWINGMAYNRHTTVEIRLMSGTLNSRQVIGWATLLVHLMDVCQKDRLNGNLLDWEVLGDSDQALEQLVDMGRLGAADQRDGFSTAERARADRAAEYLRQRWDDVQNDVAARRAERKRRLHAAWKGGPTFVPVIAHPTVTL